MGSPPRLHYDNFFNSLLTTTLVFLNEEWHIIMWNHMRIIGYYSSIYFVLVLFMGFFFFMNIFTASFINKFIDSSNAQNLFEESQSNFGKSVLKMGKSIYKSINASKAGVYLRKKTGGIFRKKEVKSKEVSYVETEFKNGETKKSNIIKNGQASYLNENFSNPESILEIPDEPVFECNHFEKNVPIKKDNLSEEKSSFPTNLKKSIDMINTSLTETHKNLKGKKRNSVFSKKDIKKFIQSFITMKGEDLEGS